MEVGNVIQRPLEINRQEQGQEPKRGESSRRLSSEDQAAESPLRADTLAVLRENIRAAATNVDDAEEAGNVLARIRELVVSQGGDAALAHSNVGSASVLDLVGA
ncbi:MAG: hypothetical protein QME81_07370 [bacterium]|nr:hypothetical protein [bacterium]